jgi:MOSC domain-containing protein YiiM
MKLVSVNVGLPHEVISRGQAVVTGIFKEPVEGRVRVRALNLDGDRQADLTVHGGPHKAVYAYPSEHYAFWRETLPGMALPFGMFGENFTTQDLREESLNLGDRFRIGEAELVVTQPRMPCYKLGIKFGRDDIVKLFLASGRSGFYFRVLREGEVGAGDQIVRIASDKNNVSVSDITRLYVTKKPTAADLELVHRAVQVEVLPDDWKGYLLHRFEKAGRQSA